MWHGFNWEHEMSEIFLSYKSEDRKKAQIIAEALEVKGFSVWWDRVIPPGKTFDEVIEEKLEAAKCVIVLWSQQSVLSDWVKNEAREGSRRQILIPVLIEEVKIPFEFRHIQAAWLIDWQGTLPNPEFDLLLKSVSIILGRHWVEKEIRAPTSPNEIILKGKIEKLYLRAQEGLPVERYNEALNILSKDNKDSSTLTDTEKMIKPFLEGLLNDKLSVDNYIRTISVFHSREKEIKVLSISARRLYDEGKHSEAIEKWKQVIKLDPKNQEAIKRIKESKSLWKKLWKIQ